MTHSLAVQATTDQRVRLRLEARRMNEMHQRGRSRQAMDGGNAWVFDARGSEGRPVGYESSVAVGGDTALRAGAAHEHPAFRLAPKSHVPVRAQHAGPGGRFRRYGWRDRCGRACFWSFVFLGLYVLTLAPAVFAALCVGLPVSAVLVKGLKVGEES